MIVNNPIIKGFSPDPSICRVGEYFYLCNSSFSFFPGLPVYRSRDLANWEHIGYGITRRSQLDFTQCRHSGGVFAPTIRYYNGLFYIINAHHAEHGGGYYITAKDPAGEWSDPIFALEGGDPELFFDEDNNKVYLIAQRLNSEGVRYSGDSEIFAREFDINNNCLIGERITIWRGALKNAIWLEGPHLHKIGKYYYLFAAEGGTGNEHAVVVARSENVLGPYEGCPWNPILTHRHLGPEAPVRRTGHSDIVEYDGNWYMVLLATRNCDGYEFMGRETFLAKMKFYRDWPIINPGEGRLLPKMNINMTPYNVDGFPDRDDFDDEKLSLRWQTLRNPDPDMYNLKERKGYITLKTESAAMTELKNLSFLSVHQADFNYYVITKIDFNPLNDYESAGIAYMHSENNHLRFEITLRNKTRIIRAVTVINGVENEIAFNVFPDDGEAELKFEQQGVYCKCLYRIIGNSEFKVLADNIDVCFASEEHEIQCVGNCVGVFSSSKGKSSKNRAYFDYFEYKKLDK